MPNQICLLTFYDAISHLKDWCGGTPNVWNQDAAYSAVRRAYDELVKVHNWNYYWRAGRVNLEAKYETGTVAYDHTGGTYERQLTLTSGTWPTNAAYGWVRIDAVNYRVATRETSTVVTLDASSNPGADVASGTSYEWFRSEYVLPVHFRRMTHPHLENNRNLSYVDQEELFGRERKVTSFGTPTLYTILGDENTYGSHAIKVYPLPTAAETLDFMMQVWPRELKVSGLDDADSSQADGITVSTSGSTATVSAALFDSARHPGAIIRFGTANDIPTGYEGRMPPVEERVLTSVTSTTAAVLDRTPTTALSSVKFRISDPVDVSRGMYTAFLRGCEAQMAFRTRDAKYIAMADTLYEKALNVALGNDNVETSYGVAGENYGLAMYGGLSPIEQRLVW